MRRPRFGRPRNLRFSAETISRRKASRNTEKTQKPTLGLLPVTEQAGILKIMKRKVYTTVMQVEMDDSDGGLGVVISACNDGWQAVFDAATEELRAEMHQRFWKMQRNKDWIYGTEMLMCFFLDLQWSEKLRRKNLAKLDKLIETTAPHDGELSEYLLQRERIMQTLGATEEDVLNFWKTHLNVPTAKKRLVELYTESNPEAAIMLLEEEKRSNWDIGTFYSAFTVSTNWLILIAPGKRLSSPSNTM